MVEKYLWSYLSGASGHGFKHLTYQKWWVISLITWVKRDLYPTNHLPSDSVQQPNEDSSLKLVEKREFQPHRSEQSKEHQYRWYLQKSCHCDSRESKTRQNYGMGLDTHSLRCSIIFAGKRFLNVQNTSSFRYCGEKKNLIKYPKVLNVSEQQKSHRLYPCWSHSDSISQPRHIPAPSKAEFQHCFLSTS